MPVFRTDVCCFFFTFKFTWLKDLSQKKIQKSIPKLKKFKNLSKEFLNLLSIDNIIFMHACIRIYISSLYSRNTRLRRDFPPPSGEQRLRRRLWRPPPSAAIKEKSIGAHRVPHIWGARGTPDGLKNLTRFMRIPNMCLVLKLDNGKVVSIANEQTDRITQPSSTVL